MRLSTRTRYGMRAVLELALAYGGNPLQIKVIAERQKISSKYLEQLIAVLKAAGVVRSIRGPHGGYLLAKPPQEVTLEEIFRVLEGPVLTVECVEHADVCPSCAECVTRKIWQEMNDAIIGVLANRTLKDLVDLAESDSKNPNYSI